MRNKIGGDETECFGCKGSYNQAENTDVTLQWVFV